MDLLGDGGEGLPGQGQFRGWGSGGESGGRGCGGSGVGVEFEGEFLVGRQELAGVGGVGVDPEDGQAALAGFFEGFLRAARLA